MIHEGHVQLAKVVIRCTAQIGTGKIIGETIKNNTVRTTIPQRVMVMFGSYALTGLVSEKVGPYMDEQVDEAVELFNKAKKWIDENRQKKVVITTESP